VGIFASSIELRIRRFALSNRSERRGLSRGLRATVPISPISSVPLPGDGRKAVQQALSLAFFDSMAFLGSHAQRLHGFTEFPAACPVVWEGSRKDFPYPQSTDTVDGNRMHSLAWLPVPTEKSIPHVIPRGFAPFDLSQPSFWAIPASHRKQILLSSHLCARNSRTRSRTEDGVRPSPRICRGSRTSSGRLRGAT
jgi:hypothetical protein